MYGKGNLHHDLSILRKNTRYDNKIVEENNLLNKMILERCRNIVDGKILTRNDE